MTTCQNGHSNPAGSAFCSTCGSPVRPSEPTWGSPSESVPVAAPAAPEQAGKSSRLGGLSPRALTLGIVVLVLLAAATVALVVIPGQKTTIDGTFTLFADGSMDGGTTDCEGTGGYDDIDAGTKVTVRNEDDKIVGSGNLRNAESAEEIAERFVRAEEGVSMEDALEVVNAGDGFVCFLLFDVPVENAKFYDIEVGSRGKISESRSELEGSDWVAQFSVGN